MKPITLCHKQGKAIFRDDSITIEWVDFPTPAPHQVQMSQVIAVLPSMTIPSVIGQRGGISITLRLANAPAVDLELVSPLTSARQVIAALEKSIAERPVALAEAAPAEAMAPVTTAPVVVAPMAASLAAQEQIMKVYWGGDCARQFKKDAIQLARQGWRVQSQSYGVQTRKAGFVIKFSVPWLAAGTKPREMTVIYVRG